MKYIDKYQLWNVGEKARRKLGFELYVLTCLNRERQTPVSDLIVVRGLEHFCFKAGYELGGLRPYSINNNDYEKR